MSVYSQDGEEEWIASRITPATPRTFIDIGAGDGERWSNTRLLLDQGWSGVWVDADPENIEKAQRVNPQSLCSRVTAENAAALFVPQTVGVLSIDIDGMDYWIWKALHEARVQAHLVVIEAQIQKPFDEPFVQSYDPNYVWDGSDYNTGASVCSLIALGQELGYAYAGKSENKHSPNLFFERLQT